MSARALTIGERIQTLGMCPVFTGVAPDGLALLAEMLETERYRAGEAVFECGDPSDRAFVVASGSLSVCVPGQPTPVRTLGPGDLVGEYGMFSGMTRTATLRAAADAVLLSLEYPRFRAFLLQCPEGALVLLKAAVERLVAAERRQGVEGG